MDRLGAHMRGLRPGQPCNGFRMEEETNFSNLKHRFSCQEISDPKKKKNYNHKEKGFAVCTKGPGCVKSDSEMEPETGDNGAGRKRWGRGTRASVPGPEGQGETPAQRSASVRALPPAPPPTATPSLCPPPSPHEPRFQRWAPGLNPNTSRDSCHRLTQSPRRPLLKGPGEAERILGAETISGLSELFIL